MNYTIKIGGQFDAAQLQGQLNAIHNLKVDIQANITQDSMDKMTQAVKQGASAHKKAQDDVRGAVDKTGESYGNVLSKIALWGAATSVIYKPVRALQDSLDVLKKMDSQLVTIQKVTGGTAEETRRFADEAQRAATTMGRVATDYLEAATIFARAGFADEQILRMSELSLLLQNVGDISSDQASKFLLATNAAWQLNGSYESLMHVVDGMNLVTNKNATDFDKLTEGITVAGAALASTGMTVEDFTSLLGTATAATQRSGSEVARALRTIAMNIRQVKGEFEDGEILDENSWAAAEKALMGVGISTKEIVNGSRELRDVIDVLNDLAAVWDTLGTEAQSNILNALAGKRQASVLASLMQSYSQVSKMQTEFANSAGSAMEENAIYLESWEAKANKLSATWTEFVEKTINSDMAKKFLDMLTGIVKGLGNLGNAITLILGLLMAFKGQGTAKAILEIFPKLSRHLSTLKGLAADAGGGLRGLITALIGTATSAEVLQAALSGLLIIIPLILMAVDAAKRAAEERRQAAYDAADAAQEEINAGNDLLAQYNEIMSTMDAGEERRSKLIPLQEQMIALYGEEAEAIDVVNGAMGETNRLWLEQQRQNIQENLPALQSAVNEASKTLTDKGSKELAVSVTDDIKSEVQGLWRGINGLKGVELLDTEPGYELTGISFTTDDVAERHAALGKYLERLREANLEESQYYTDISQQYTAYGTLIGDHEAKTKSLMEAKADMAVLDKAIATQIPKTTSEYENLVEKLREGAGANKEWADALEESAARSFPALASELKNTADEISAVDREFERIYGGFLRYQEGASSGRKRRISHLIDEKYEPDKELAAQIEDIAQKVVYLNNVFGQGAMSVGEYFQQLNAYIRDFQANTDDVEVGAIFGAAIPSIEGVIDSLSSAFEKGDINIGEYAVGLNDVGKGVAEFANIFSESLEGMGGEAEKWQGQINEVLGSLQDELENAIDVEGLSQEFYKIFEAFDEDNMSQIVESANSIGEQLYNAYANNLEALQPLVDTLGYNTEITMQNIADAIASSPEGAQMAMAMLNQSAKQALADTLNAAADTLDKLADSIDSVDGNITFSMDKPFSLKSSGLKAENLFTPGGEVLSLTDSGDSKIKIEGNATSAAIRGLAAGLRSDAANILTSNTDMISPSNFKPTGSGKKGGGGGSKSKKKVDELKQYKEDKRILEHEEWLAQQRQGTYEEDTEKYIAEHEKRISVTKQLIKLAEDEIARLRAKGLKDTSEEIQQLEKDWWGYYNSLNDMEEELQKAKDDFRKKQTDELHAAIKYAIDQQNKSYDAQIDRLESLIALEKSYFELTKNIKAEQRNINAELEVSKKAYEYLDDELRKTIFNEKDYDKLSSKLNTLTKDANRLYSKYTKEINALSEDNMWQAEFITKEFERQYELKLREYEIAKAELELAKAQSRLNNAMAERNVRMFINGQWQYTADPEAIEEAMRAVAEAEQDYADAIDESAHERSIAEKEATKDSIASEKERIAALWDEILAAFEEPVGDIAEILKDIAENGAPELKEILSTVSKSMNSLLKALGINVSVKKEQPKSSATTAATTETTPEKKSFGVGDSVKVSGKWTSDSYGGGKTGTPKSGESYTIGKIFTDGRSNPYRIDKNGTPMGWATAAQLYDQGGILQGMGGIKATPYDEAILYPKLTDMALNPVRNERFDKFASSLETILQNINPYSALAQVLASPGMTSILNNGGETTIYQANINGVIKEVDSDTKLSDLFKQVVPLNRPK